VKNGTNAPCRLRLRTMECKGMIGNLAHIVCDAIVAIDATDAKRRATSVLTDYQTRNTAPSFLPKSRLAPRRVIARKAIAQTPSAAATYFPVPINWKSS